MLERHHIDPFQITRLLQAADAHHQREEAMHTDTDTDQTPAHGIERADAVRLLAAAQRRLERAENEIRNARAAWYDLLPDLTNGTHCSQCGAGGDWRDIQIVEDGYQRWTSCEVTDGILHAITDGWDDMSEGGQTEYAECQKCSTPHKTPDNLEWD